ncbi:tripartite tricarboxylate transporter substrate binding protein [Ramlibacter sp.]|uniref:Bug family tripartite tricarboxylate transporter substrate binding protein n=1 Tax=Ramlibacter sp. TaxID=1917967 RepID=UPI001822A08D|nr:tripartite tricarboxylate transporter substrate binding protein [Ramlibacter sp.]MBA2672774.1 tripartite tricarboxylate transporter substrate binding protein [Ramlibacter sp.]
MTTRRRFLHTAAGSAAAVTLPALAQAGWPRQPITLVDPFPAGNNTDYFSRLVADRLGPLLGTRVIVENRAGAAGLIGATYVANAKPDGYTLGLATVSTLCAGPAVHSPATLKYDPLKDFSFITKLVTLPSVLVANPKLPAKDFGALLALTRQQPRRVTCGVPGLGSAGHVLTEYLMKLANMPMLIVPYKGGGAMLTDLIAGQIDVLSNNIPELLQHVRSGAVRALAVRDVRRAPALPDIPTYKELGLGEVSNPLWFGLVAPAGVPEPILARLRAATHKAMVDPVFVDKTIAVAGSISPTSGTEFRADAAALLAQMQQVVKSAGIKPE